MFTFLSSYTFSYLECATIPQFYNGFFLPVLHSGHKIFLFSSSYISSPVTIFSFILCIPYFCFSFCFYFHAPKQSLHYIFLNCFLETNPCPQFSWVFISLYLYPSHSTYVTTSHFILHSLFSSTVLLRGIPYVLLYSYTFIHKSCTGFLYLCCTSHGLAIYATSLLLLFLFTSMFGHSYLKCSISQHLKYCTFSFTFYCLTSTSPLMLYLITLLTNTLSLFWGIDFPFFSISLFL